MSTPCKLEDMFRAASINGFDKMKFRLPGLVISAAGAGSKNPGALYVKTADAERRYLGKIKDGKFWSAYGVAVPAAQMLAIRAAMDNPQEQAALYGRQNGNCCLCGRTLTAAESVRNHIGPICAEKAGFVLAEPAPQQAKLEIL
jgi:hypothetical protein